MVTFCTLHVALRFNLFEAKPVDMKTVMLFGILNGVSIGFLNLSLGFNSIGFYQVYFNIFTTSNKYINYENIYIKKYLVLDACINVLKIGPNSPL